MVRAYLRLDPAYDEHKESYPDGPYAALIACFCHGEMQPHRGRFRNERFLRAILGPRGRHVPYLLEHGDLVRLPDGRVYIDGWDEWQEGDWKVTERVTRIRTRRHRNVTVPVTVDVTPATVTPVTPPVTADRKSVSVAVGVAVGAGGAEQPPTADLPPLTVVIDYLEDRTKRPWHFRPGSPPWDTLDADVRDFGAEAVMREMALIDVAHPDHGQLIFGATRRLHTIEAPAKEAAPDPAYVAQVLADRRAERKATRSA